MIQGTDRRVIVADELVSVFRALAHPDRMALLEALLTMPKGVGNITALAAQVGLDRFAASRQLTVLAEAGLVKIARRKGHRMHCVDMRAFHSIEDWLYRFDDVEAIEQMIGTARGG